jgi:hypothetical protein
MAKNSKKAAKKQAIQDGRTLAGRTLTRSRAPMKDKRLAASVLSQAGRTKSKRKKKKK